LVTNWIDDKPYGEGIGTAAIAGALSGGLGAGVGKAA
jgi:hypothetical protein